MAKKSMILKQQRGSKFLHETKTSMCDAPIIISEMPAAYKARHMEMQEGKTSRDRH